MPWYFLRPVNGSTNSLRLIWSAIWSSSSCPWYIPVFAFYSSLLYLHNALLPRNVDRHTDTLDLHVCRISSGCFSLWDIPWFVVHYTSVEYWWAYGCDPGTLLPVWSPLLFARTTFWGFVLYPLLFVHISPFFDISVQIPHDTGISMLCIAGLRYLFHYKKTPLYFVGAVSRPHFHDTRGTFHYIILFTLPGRAGGCCFAKANQYKNRSSPYGLLLFYKSEVTEW